MISGLKFTSEVLTVLKFALQIRLPPNSRDPTTYAIIFLVSFLFIDDGQTSKPGIMRAKPLDTAGVKFAAHWISVAIDR